MSDDDAVPSITDLPAERDRRAVELADAVLDIVDSSEYGEPMPELVPFMMRYRAARRLLRPASGGEGG